MSNLFFCFFPQFLIYSSYFAAIAVIFLVAGLYKVVTRRSADAAEVRNEHAKNETESSVRDSSTPQESSII